MALVPSDSDLSSSRIDYFSSLPNELLDDIFEQAYEDSRPTKPLSKRLLPFFEKHLYRKISISSFPRSSLLPETVSARPYKGQYIIKMNLAALRDPTETNLDLLANLFPLLPNLTHLECSLLTHLYERNPKVTTSLSSLQYLSMSIRSDHREGVARAYLDLGQLSFLQELPHVCELTLNSYAIYPAGNVHGFDDLWLPHLQSLRIEGPGAEDLSVSFVTGRCPALLHLTLHSTWNQDLDIFGYLGQQPSSLESLSLSVEYGTVVIHDGQSLLERFTQLRSLHLGDQCYDSNIPSTLLKLPLLVETHLGQGPIEPEELLPLVSGPTRLLFLKTITLDAYPGNVGKKISSPSTQGFDSAREIRRCPPEMNDWDLPGSDDDIELNVLGLRRLIEAGKENGVTIKGGVLSALQTVEDYHLEANNRAIVATYFVDMARLRQVRRKGLEDGFPPPSLRFDNLEIVEMELPERKWFALDLRSVRK